MALWRYMHRKNGQIEQFGHFSEIAAGKFPLSIRLPADIMSGRGIIEYIFFKISTEAVEETGAK